MSDPVISIDSNDHLALEADLEPDLIEDDPLDPLAAISQNSNVQSPPVSTPPMNNPPRPASQQPLPNPVTVMFKPFTDPRSAKNPYHGIKRYFVFASGARPEVLSQCPTDEATHVGLGGTVIATSGLSAISMVFALHNALHVGLFASILAGFIWALIIFNMDRWLIVSQKRLESPWKQWVNVIPRVIVALLLGFVISEPLVHQLFRSELDREIQVNLADNNASDVARLQQKSKEYKDLKNARLKELSDTSTVSIGSESSLRTEINSLKKEISDAQAAYNTAQTELTAEIEGISKTGKAGCGQACAVKQVERDQKLDLLNQVKEKNDPRIAEKQAALDKTLGENDAARQQLIADNKAEQDRIVADLNTRAERDAQAEDRIVNQAGTGLLADISALSGLEDKNSGVMIAHYLILFLFVALDTIPVIGKTLILTGAKRPYELVCDAIDTRTKLEAELLVADAEYEQQQHVNLVRADADIRTQVQIDNNDHFVRAAAQTQRDVGEMLLDQWRDNELARVKKDLKKKPPKPI
jgi:hypothetical protein